MYDHNWTSKSDQKIKMEPFLVVVGVGANQTFLPQCDILRG